MATQGSSLVSVKVVDDVTSRVMQLTDSGELQLPPDYSAVNALKSAWLILQETRDKDGKPVLKTCSQASVASSLFHMVVMGLSPELSQCYFIAYGTKLVCQRGYLGSIALLKRIYGQETYVSAQVVYKADEFSLVMRRGMPCVDHQTNLGNEKTPIVAAYAIIGIEGRDDITEVMSIEEIQKAWQQGATNGKSPAHKNFPGPMCKKTVLGRACKLLIKTSNDGYLMRHIEDYDLEAAEAEVAATSEGSEPVVLELEPTQGLRSEGLDRVQIDHLRELAESLGVSWEAIEEDFGGPIVPGSEHAEDAVAAAINQRRAA